MHIMHGSYLLIWYIISSELVRRLRTLTMTLLPLEVPPESISDPTSRIITPQVIKAYIAAAGDLVEAVCKYIITSPLLPFSQQTSYLIVC